MRAIRVTYHLDVVLIELVISLLLGLGLHHRQLVLHLGRIHLQFSTLTFPCMLFSDVSVIPRFSMKYCKYIQVSFHYLMMRFHNSTGLFAAYSMTKRYSPKRYPYRYALLLRDVIHGKSGAESLADSFFGDTLVPYVPRCRRG